MNPPDLGLYVIVDPDQLAGRDPVAVAQAAARGGAGVIQLRDKRGHAGRTLALAREMKAALAGTDVHFVINDRVDIALSAGADGVHVGQSDLPAEAARALMGDTTIIGLSLKTEREIAAAPVEALSYGAIGGVFPTSGKHQARPPVGPAGLARLAAALRTRRADLPVIAIAGITTENAAEVMAAGVDGVAVISAVCAADDPERAARRLRSVVDAARRERRTP